MSDTENRAPMRFDYFVEDENLYRESALSATEVGKLFTDMRAEWEVRDDGVWESLRNCVFGAFAINGTSNRSSYRGHFTVAGRKFERSVIHKVLATAGIRRFARGDTYYYDKDFVRHDGPMADAIRLLILEHPKMAEICWKNYGADPRLAHLCFDVSKYCSGLSTTELSFANAISNKVLNNASSYSMDLDKLNSDDNRSDGAHGGGHYDY
jgi:hypothetical protein